MLKLKDLKALFLDLGGTLIHARGGVGLVYVSLAEKYGIQLDLGEIGTRFFKVFERRQQEALDRNELAYGTSDAEARTFWREMVSEVFEPAKIEPQTLKKIFEDLYEFFATGEAWEIYPDVVPLLDAAGAQNIKTVLVSNWDSRLDVLLDALELTDRFDAIIGSYAVKVEKPDPAIFRAALAAINEEPDSDRILHIGDSYKADVLGARQAGLSALHLDRKEVRPPADDRIKSLLEIL